MKARIVILNDAGKKMSKAQAKKEVTAFIMAKVADAYEKNVESIEIFFGTLVNGEESVTLRDLLDLSV